MDMIFCMNVLIYFSEAAAHPGAAVLRHPGTRRLLVSWTFGVDLQNPVKFQAIVLNDCILYRKPTADELQKPELVAEGRA